MDVAFCPQCKSRYGLNPKLPNNNMKCPQCKSALVVQDAPEPKKQQPQPAPLSLDDDDELPPPSPEESPKRGVPIALIGGLIAFGILVVVGGGVAAWMLLQDKPAETAEAVPAEDDGKTEKPAPVKPDVTPTTGKTAPKADANSTEVSPIVLLSRAKAGAPVERIEAINQLGRLGDEAKSAVPDLIGLLDDAEEGVRRAAAEALKRVGEPASADAACIPRALSGTGRNGRLHALRHYSTKEAASAEQLPLLVKSLDDSELAVRDQALSALEKFGPASRNASFTAILGRVLDPDPAFASRVAKWLISLAPFEVAERKLLIENLRYKAWQQRRMAVILLAPGSPDESTASVWFESLLKDDSAEVRAAALSALAKWPKAMKRLQPALIVLIRDDHAEIRTAALRALGQYGSGTEAKNALLGAAGPTASAEVRALAIQSLLAMDYGDAKADLPILTALLKMEDAKIRAAAFAKAAGLKADARELLPQIGDGLVHADPAVQIEALKLAGVVGPEAASLVPKVSALLLGKSKATEAVQIQAAETLVQLGPTAKEPLLEAIGAALPTSVVKRVCESLGRKGTEVPARLVPQLFLLAEKSTELRTPLSELIARIGGDDIARACADRTFWSNKTLGNGKKIKECKYELGVQVWAIETMGRMDPKTLTEKGRDILLERMKSLQKTNPDIECRKAAEDANVKLVAAGLSDKP